MIWGKLPHSSVEIAGDADLVQAAIANQINRFRTPHNQVRNSFECPGDGCDSASPIRGICPDQILQRLQRDDQGLVNPPNEGSAERSLA